MVSVVTVVQSLLWTAPNFVCHENLFIYCEMYIYIAFIYSYIISGMFLFLSLKAVNGSKLQFMVITMIKKCDF